jgi:hypothetical protein
MAAAAATLAVAVPVAAASVTADVVLELPVVEQARPAQARVTLEEAAVQQMPPPPPPRPARVVTVAPTHLPAVGNVSQSKSSLKIQVLDQTGGVIPGARIAVTDTATGTIRPSLTSSVGGASLHGLPGGQYEVGVSLAGFTSVYDRITLPEGGQLERTYRLPIGTLTEALAVSCHPSPSATRAATLVRLVMRLVRQASTVLSAQELPRAPVRVGGSVQAPRKQRDAKPVCPSDPPATVTITLAGRLGIDGRVHDLEAVHSPDAMPAAIDAVRAAVSQWIYTPARLNNVPVDVNIMVTVTFTKQ